MSNYLYNGIELPDINTVWTDKEKYPYAFIHEFNGDYHAYKLRIAAGTQQVTSSGSSGVDFDDGEWYALKDGSTEWVGSNSLGGQVLWANFDVLYDSAQGDLAGTLYLAASDPVPVLPLDPTALLMGWLAGKRMAAMRQSGNETPKEPIAYLYNGVRLPDINAVWTDKETYPYAVISDASESVTFSVPCYQLMISSSPTEVSSSGSRFHVSDAVAKRYVIVGDSAELDAIMTENNMTDEDLEALLGVGRRSWLLMNEYDLFEAGFAIDSRPTNWSNHDILNPDGTTYLAASEPIPVYE